MGPLEPWSHLYRIFYAPSSRRTGFSPQRTALIVRQPTAITAGRLIRRGARQTRRHVRQTCEVSAATVSPTTMPAAAAAAGVCLECEKRHDEDQDRGHASASRQH